MRGKGNIMLKYKQENVNPKGRKTGDCSTRALAKLLDIGWDEALELQFRMSLKTKYDMTSHQVIERILSEHGWTKMKQPRKSDGTKYQVREMDILVPHVRHKRVLCTVAHHYVVIVDDEYVDTWNSGYKTVGNYFIKE